MGDIQTTAGELGKESCYWVAEGTQLARRNWVYQVG